MRAPRIVVVGSSNTDLVASSPRIPSPGETIIGGEFSVAPGGKGANQAVAAARLGGEVSFVGCIGNDDFGAAALAGLQGDGVDVTHVRRDESARSGVALIVLTPSGENAIVVAPGANASVRVDDVDRVEALIRAADLLLLQLEIPLDAIGRALEVARDAGVTTLLDPAPAQALDRATLRRVDWLTPNETEAGQLVGGAVASAQDAERAAASLRELGPRNVVITRGTAGALYLGADGSRHAEAFAVEAVDTVAAGDVFSGALAVALGERRDTADALRFACGAAAISVTRRGAQPSIPRREEVETLVAAENGSSGVDLGRNPSAVHDEPS